jgi:hypothetical protein
MPGMLAIRIYKERKILTRLVEKDCEVMIAEPRPTGNLESGRIDLYSWNNKKDLYLDLEDPATLGCLLFLVREAWKDPAIATSDLAAYDAYNWVTIIRTEHLELQPPHTSHGVTYFCGETEAESLVVALEAANEL